MKWPQLPDYGCIHRWPENGCGFIHSADVPVAKQLFPSDRVFRRDAFDGTYYQCTYGRTQFRLRPCLWLPIRWDGIDVGDEVETTGVGMARELFVATVSDMIYAHRKRCILYRLRRCDSTIPTLFTASDLRLLADKSKVKPNRSIHPAPKWNGQGDRLKGISWSRNDRRWAPSGGT